MKKFCVFFLFLFLFYFFSISFSTSFSLIQQYLEFVFSITLSKLFLEFKISFTFSKKNIFKCSHFQNIKNQNFILSSQYSINVRKYKKWLAFLKFCSCFQNLYPLKLNVHFFKNSTFQKLLLFLRNRIFEKCLHFNVLGGISKFIYVFHKMSDFQFTFFKKTRILNEICFFLIFEISIFWQFSKIIRNVSESRRCSVLLNI